MRLFFVFAVCFCCSALALNDGSTDDLAAASVALEQARDLARSNNFEPNTDKALCFELGMAKGFRGASLYVIEKNVDRQKPFLELEYNLDILVHGFCFMGMISRAEASREIDKYLGELKSIMDKLK